MVCIVAPKLEGDDGEALLEVLTPDAREKGVGDADFASVSLAGGVTWLLPEPDWVCKGEEAGFVVAFAGSTGTRSAPTGAIDADGFFPSLSGFDAASVLLAVEVFEVEDELGVSAGGFGLALPKENGWLPKDAPALRPGLKELNGDVEAFVDVALTSSTTLTVAEGSNENKVEPASLFGVWTAGLRLESVLAGP